MCQELFEFNNTITFIVTIIWHCKAKILTLVVGTRKFHVHSESSSLSIPFLLMWSSFAMHNKSTDSTTNRKSYIELWELYQILKVLHFGRTQWHLDELVASPVKWIVTSSNGLWIHPMGYERGAQLKSYVGPKQIWTIPKSHDYVFTHSKVAFIKKTS